MARSAAASETTINTGSLSRNSSIAVIGSDSRTTTRRPLGVWLRMAA